MPQSVVNAITEHLQLETQIGGYEAAALRNDRFEAAHTALAELFGCKPHNIALRNNATEAYSVALSAIPFERGDVLLTTNNDYISNQIAFLALQKRLGIKVLRAPDVPEGGVDVDAM